MQMINLTDQQVEQLNSLERVSDFPSIFKTPGLNTKVDYKLRSATGGVCLFAKERIEENEIICFGNGSIIDKPIIYSYQIEENMHLIGPGGLDHNCQKPNCYLESGTHNFIALRTIEKDEFLSFNYLTTEYSMNNSFLCNCGEEGCFKNIKGFKYLTNREKEYVSRNFQMSDYIKKRYSDFQNSI